MIRSARLKAAGVHLGLSAAVAGMLLLWTTHWLYPWPLLDLTGGRDIFLLYLVCDLSLGPVLTLVVFNIAKPRRELVRDLGVIALVQIAAMVYGISTLYVARPAFIVYNAGQFNVTLANEVQGDAAASGAGGKTWRAAWFTGPQIVAARLPADPRESNQVLFSALRGQGDVYQMTRYFVPYDELRTEMLARALAPADFARREHVSPDRLKESLVRAHVPASALLLPLLVRTRTAIAAIDGGTGAWLGILPMPEPRF